MGNLLLLSTKTDSVVSNKPCDLTDLQPCNHVEADTRIILHLKHGVQQGHEYVFIRTVDSDVLVLAISFFQELQQIGLIQLWVGLASGKHYRDIPVHEISSLLGPQKSLALPLFHALSGCDTTSQMLGCGKKLPGPYGLPCQILQIHSSP